MIQLQNVSKWYGSFQVLTDCSTSIKKGEVVVICGPSGSGKSTLLRGVNALNPVVRGEVRVSDGEKMVSVTKADPETLRKLRLSRIAMVFQDPMSSLNPVFTVGTQLCEPLIKHLALSRRAALARAEELLAKVGMAHKRDA